MMKIDVAIQRRHMRKTYWDGVKKDIKGLAISRGYTDWNKWRMRIKGASG